jgi:hypothetical protein
MMEQHIDPQNRAAFPGSFVWSGAVAIMGLVALFIAAHAGHGIAYYGGLTFFAFAVLFIFLMIKRGYDQAQGISGGGLPLFARVAGSAVIGYLIYGLAGETIPDKAILIGVAAAVVVFALLAVIDRIAIRAE